MSLNSKISAVPATAAIEVAHLALDRIQTETPERQVAGIAMLFRSMCIGAGLSVSEILNKVERMERDADLGRQVSALNDYVKGELA